MENWRKEIQDKQDQQKEQVFKGIVGGEEMLEKARQVGETKQGKDGITRVWSKTPSGYDWRRVKTDKKGTGGGGKSAKKTESSDDKESASSNKKTKPLLDKEGYERLGKKIGKKAQAMADNAEAEANKTDTKKDDKKESSTADKKVVEKDTAKPDKLDANDGKEILDDIINNPNKKGREVLDFVSHRIPMTERQWNRYAYGSKNKMLLDSKDPKDKTKLLKSLRKLLIKPENKEVETGANKDTANPIGGLGHTMSKDDFQNAIKAGDIVVEKTDLHEWQDSIGPSVKMWVQTEKGVYKKGKVDWDNTSDTDNMTLKFEDGTTKKYSGFSKVVWRSKKPKKSKADSKATTKKTTPPKKKPAQKSPGMTAKQLKATKKKSDSGDASGAANDVLGSWMNL